MSEENKKLIEDIKKDLPEAKKMAFRNYHWYLLRTWLIFISTFIITLIIGFIIGFYAPSPTSINVIDFEDIAKTLIAPSVTMNGLFITIVPVVAFFYMAEIKDNQKEEEEQFRELKKDFKEDEDLKVINTARGLTHAFYHNFKSGILRYVRTFLFVSLMLLITLLTLYVGLSHSMPSLFVLFDTIVLLTVFTGVFPIIAYALYSPTLKLKTYIIPEKIVEKIEYEG